MSAGLSQDATLSLASASGTPGSSISLDLTLTSGQNAVASAQWTLSYWPVDVAGIAVTAGPAAAGKSLYCAPRAGAIKCILAGLSSGVLANGVVARVSVKLASGTSGTVSTIGMAGTLGASPKGDTIPVQGHASIITITQPAHLNSVVCSPQSLATPGAAVCSLAMSAPAPASVTFQLSSANTHIITPVSVSIPPGGNTAAFNITASAVASAALAPLTATLGAQSVTTTVILAPPGGGVSTAAVLNGASYANGAVAPGEIVSILGSGLGPPEGAGLQMDSGGVTTRLAGARALFDGVSAPLLYAGGDQINAVVPFSIFGRASTQVQVEYLGVLSKTLTVPIAAAGPGIFARDASGAGQGAILNQDGTANSAVNPAAPGSVVMIYATGAGQMDPRPADGSITGSVLAKPVGKVTVWIGGAQAEVQYAGAAPDLVSGMLQVNARIPAGIATGPSVPVLLAVGGYKSQGDMTLAVQ